MTPDQESGDIEAFVEKAATMPVDVIGIVSKLGALVTNAQKAALARRSLRDIEHDPDIDEETRADISQALREEIDDLLNTSADTQFDHAIHDAEKHELLLKIMKEHKSSKPKFGNIAIPESNDEEAKEEIAREIATQTLRALRDMGVVVPLHDTVATLNALKKKLFARKSGDRPDLQA